MKNYQNSDYALNRYSEGIVYRFADGVAEITLADYLAQNPGNTAEDFQALKELSDAIYLEQDRAENAQTKKNCSIHGMEHTKDFGAVPMDEQYIEIQETRYAAQAIRELLDSDVLTEVERRRFVLHIIQGVSMRKIARQEGTSHQAVMKSIRSAVSKVKNIS